MKKAKPSFHRHPNLRFSVSFFLLIFHFFVYGASAGEDVQLPTRCESCAIFAKEFEDQFRSRSPATMKGEHNELWLIEALERQCARMLEYKLHKDKDGLARFSKEQSSTMKTLRKLRERGVQVELGMPYEMWDTPSAEVSSLKQQCELILEQYEDAIEEWYKTARKPSLQKYLCEDRVLRKGDASCLPAVHSEF